MVVAQGWLGAPSVAVRGLGLAPADTPGTPSGSIPGTARLRPSHAQKVSTVGQRSTVSGRWAREDIKSRRDGAARFACPTPPPGRLSGPGIISGDPEDPALCPGRAGGSMLRKNNNRLLGGHFSTIRAHFLGQARAATDGHWTKAGPSPGNWRRYSLTGGGWAQCHSGISSSKGAGVGARQGAGSPGRGPRAGERYRGPKTARAEGRVVDQGGRSAYHDRRATTRVLRLYLGPRGVLGGEC